MVTSKNKTNRLLKIPENENTVFIIGAGASTEVNFPDGNTLKSIISNLLDIRYNDWGERLEHGDSLIVKALSLFVQEPNGQHGDIIPYLNEARHIRDALPLAISIDNFIDSQKDNDKIALCGKLAIARSILKAEKESLLNFEGSNTGLMGNYNSLKEAWYLLFFQLLTENCSKDDLNDRFKSITLIIFNYDRCVEHFLYHALQNYYRISSDEAAKIISSINIYHPYNSIGLLPWHKPHYGTVIGTPPMHISFEQMINAIAFGAVPSPNELLKLAQGIKTFTEGTDPQSSEIIKIRKHMSTADKLVFIGFAFHKLNMHLIEPNDKENIVTPPVCYATTHLISESDKQTINSQINSLYKKVVDIKMANLKCGPFFKEFWRSLSF